MWPARPKQTAKHRVSHNQSVLVKILQIILFLKDWNICFQSETKQNYQQTQLRLPYHKPQSVIPKWIYAPQV